jgi:pyruvate dehydrogenase E1 component alpha subunit
MLEISESVQLPSENSNPSMTQNTSKKTAKAKSSNEKKEIVFTESSFSDRKAPAVAKVKGDFDRETYIKWFTIMLRIRRFEEEARRAYTLDKKIKGFCHVYIGQEAIAAGMLTASKITDSWITAYRQHGQALAKGVTMREAMAELFGRYTGNVKGKGGSMHFFHAENKYFGGHGIVGGQIGLGAGLAFAEKYKGTDNVAISMFGDGAARQGILFESFNMAMTWKLPVIFICENNFYAMGTSVERTSNVTDIYKFGAAFDMPSFQVDGMSPEAVHNAVLEAADRARRGEGPTLLEIRTYRYYGHSMSDPQAYRSKQEVEDYKDIDPILVTEKKLLSKKLATQAEIDAIRDAVEVEVADAVKFADESPLPPAAELYTDNYLQADYPFLKS